MKVEKVNKDTCVIITKIKEDGHTTTRVLEETTHPEEKVEYLLNGISRTKVKNLIIKTLEEEISKKVTLA